MVYTRLYRSYIISKIRKSIWCFKIFSTTGIFNYLITSTERRCAIIIIFINICPSVPIVWTLYLPLVWISLCLIITWSNCKMWQYIWWIKTYCNMLSRSVTTPLIITKSDFVIKHIVSALTSPTILTTCDDWWPIPVSSFTTSAINTIIFWVGKITTQ